jgi:hypothetical protein
LAGGQAHQVNAPIRRPAPICKILGRHGFEGRDANTEANSPVISMRKNLDLQIFTKIFLAVSGNIKGLHAKNRKNRVFRVLVEFSAAPNQRERRPGASDG